MRYLWLCVALLLSSAAYADTAKEHLEADFSRAATLHELCRGDENAKSLCAIFVMGYLSGYGETVAGLVKSDVQFDNVGAFCPHVTLDPKFMTDIFVAYMDKHPEQGSGNWPDVFTAAMADHWPCKK